MDYQCTALSQKIVPLKSNAFLYVKSIIQRVQLFPSRKSLAKCRQAPVAQGIVMMVPAQPFYDVKLIELTNTNVKEYEYSIVFWHHTRQRQTHMIQIRRRMSP